MYLLKSDLAWIKKHAKRGAGQKIYRCRKTGKFIRRVTIYRSILISRDFPSGRDVRPVAHLFCPGCNRNPVLPRYGEPVYEDQLVQSTEL